MMTSRRHLTWLCSCKIGDTTYEAQVAFQMRIRPGSYKIGQETIGATKQIDPHIPNSSLEWYTDCAEKGSVQFTGLLVKLMAC